MPLTACQSYISPGTIAPEGWGGKETKKDKSVESAPCEPSAETPGDWHSGFHRSLLLPIAPSIATYRSIYLLSLPIAPSCSLSLPIAPYCSLSLLIVLNA